MIPTKQNREEAYLDRFKVDEGFHGNSRSLVVGGIGLLPELCPPGGCLNSEPSIGSHGSGGDSSKGRSKLVRQNTANHGNFEGGRQKMENHRREKETDASVCC